MRAMRGLAALLLGAVLGVLSSAPSNAADLPALGLEGEAPSFSLDGHLAVHEGRGGVDDIEAIAADTAFRPVDRSGISTGTQWYRFTARRGADMPADWILAFGEPDIDDVRVYVPATGGGFNEIALGRRVPTSELPVAARRHVALLTLPEGEPVTIHVRLSSLHKIRFEDAALWRPAALIHKEARESALFGIRFGIVGFVAVVAALFGVWLRDPAMLAYAVYVGTMLSAGISHTSIVTLVFPDAGRSTNYLLSGIGLVGGVAAYIFMWDRILNLRRTFPVMHRVYLVTGGIAAVSLFWVMSPYFHTLAWAAQIIMLAATLSSVMLAALLVRRTPKDFHLWAYLLAFIPFILVWAAQIGGMLEVVPADLGRSLSRMAVQVHVGAISIVLAYRLRQLQHERNKAEVSLAGERLARQHQRTFVDMATHEFKTPLAVIDSAAQVLELMTARGNAEVASRTATIRRAVQRMVSLVDICLTGERNQALALTPRPMEPARFIDHLLERNRDPDRAPLVAWSSDLPDTCFADEALLGIALDALIENARRYGPVAAPVDISAQGHRDRIMFLVQDRGPGVPPAEAHLIFEKYYRCSASGATPGTGIGLHLVKTIAALHGGQAAYQPRQNGGSTFVLSIPLRPASTANDHVVGEQVAY